MTSANFPITFEGKICRKAKVGDLRNRPGQWAAFQISVPLPDIIRDNQLVGDRHREFSVIAFGTTASKIADAVRSGEFQLAVPVTVQACDIRIDAYVGDRGDKPVALGKPQLVIDGFALRAPRGATGEDAASPEPEDATAAAEKQVLDGVLAA
jgi:hypothetical protein